MAAFAAARRAWTLASAWPLRRPMARRAKDACVETDAAICPLLPVLDVFGAREPNTGNTFLALDLRTRSSPL